MVWWTCWHWWWNLSSSFIHVPCTSCFFAEPILWFGWCEDNSVFWFSLCRVFCFIHLWHQLLHQLVFARHARLFLLSGRCCAWLINHPLVSSPFLIFHRWCKAGSSFPRSSRKAVALKQEQARIIMNYCQHLSTTSQRVAKCRVEARVFE